MEGHRDRHSSLSEALAAHAALKCQWEDVDTVVMRNLPKHFNAQKVLKLLIHKQEVLDNMDFVYLPLAPDSVKSRGFAFIKFTNSSSALLCRELFHKRVVKGHAENGPVVVEPTTLVSLDGKGTMFSADIDTSMRPMYLKDPDVQKYIATERQRRRRSEKVRRLKDILDEHRSPSKSSC
eukprot:TRINITY_DN21825_c0_g1_i1.p1 TRINITY_DN21825_c0_g1~~TRINITY_DN21825_c0_g1_i1.p1  ORF type:complete len:179 (-),score=26.64 TRINITY_DN21825_c0_g1_i1:41-577(-)